MTPDPNLIRLLHGPNQPPALKRGDVATCFLRDGDVIITSWSAARIPWPRCRRVGTSGGGSGLLLDEELARAVRCESSLAIQYWWGVHEGVVWRWRKALGVGRADNEGSRLLTQAAGKKGGEAMQAKEWTQEEREARRQIALDLDLGQYLTTGYHGLLWPEEQRPAGPAVVRQT